MSPPEGGSPTRHAPARPCTPCSAARPSGTLASSALTRSSCVRSGGDDCGFSDFDGAWRNGSSVASSRVAPRREHPGSILRPGRQHAVEARPWDPRGEALDQLRRLEGDVCRAVAPAMAQLVQQAAVRQPRQLGAAGRWARDVAGQSFQSGAAGGLGMDSGAEAEARLRRQALLLVGRVLPRLVTLGRHRVGTRWPPCSPVAARDWTSRRPSADKTFYPRFCLACLSKVEMSVSLQSRNVGLTSFDHSVAAAAWLAA